MIQALIFKEWRIVRISLIVSDDYVSTLTSREDIGTQDPPNSQKVARIAFVQGPNILAMLKGLCGS